VGKSAARHKGEKTPKGRMEKGHTGGQGLGKARGKTAQWMKKKRKDVAQGRSKSG